MEQSLNLANLAGGIFISAADQELKTCGPRDRLDSPRNLGEVQVHQVRDDDTYQIRATGGQGAGVLVGPIVHSARDFKHAQASVWIDKRMIVDGARDGHLGDAQFARDVSQSYRHITLMTSC
jgi:hypothetical protein